MLNATLVNRIEITPELAIFHVAPDGGVPDFLPGQYLALGLPGSAARAPYFPPEIEVQDPEKLIKRAYSIGSPPSERHYYEFYIAILPQGALTARLANLRQGDRLFAATKVIGTFTLKEVAADKNLIFIATGTGIAPFVSMLRHEPTWTFGRKITLLHGVRFARDLAYRDELLKLEQKYPNFRYMSFVSREEPPSGGRRGYVQSAFDGGGLVVNPDQDHIFLCGNPAMCDAMSVLGTERGYSEHGKRNPTGSLHLERYW